MMEEIEHDRSGKFVTLTFNEEALEKAKKRAIKKRGSDEPNEVATQAVRDFLERWRSKYGTSVKHWLVPELGHEGTERLHLHGIIFTDKNIEERWQNGWVYIGDYVNERTINYIIKYVTKIDEKHKDFRAKILPSAGLGKGYLTRTNAKKHKFNDKKTINEYRLNNGAKVNLPIYYKNHIWTEEERGKLWGNLLDKQERYVLGQKIDTSTWEGQVQYKRALKEAQRINKKLGYGKLKGWDLKIYTEELKKLKK